MLCKKFRQGMSCSVCGVAAHKGSYAQAAQAETACGPRDKKEGRGLRSSFAAASSMVSSAASGLGGAIKRSGGKESAAPQISGPTNVQHVSGTTTGRTLVCVDPAGTAGRAPPAAGPDRGAAAAALAARPRRGASGRLKVTHWRWHLLQRIESCSGRVRGYL